MSEQMSSIEPEWCRASAESELRGQILQVASENDWRQVPAALELATQAHAGQLRLSGRHCAEKTPYIVHPLTVAQHGLALGVREENIVVAALLHDVVEDTSVTLAQLPFGSEIVDMVERLTFVKPADPAAKLAAQERYYGRIGESEAATVVKILDRCHNVSTMAGSFSPAKVERYIAETRRFVVPLCQRLQQSERYGQLAWTVQYQIESLLATAEVLLAK